MFPLLSSSRSFAVNMKIWMRFFQLPACAFLLSHLPCASVCCQFWRLNRFYLFLSLSLLYFFVREPNWIFRIQIYVLIWDGESGSNNVREEVGVVSLWKATMSFFCVYAWSLTFDEFRMMISSSCLVCQEREREGNFLFYTAHSLTLPLGPRTEADCVDQTRLRVTILFFLIYEMESRFSSILHFSLSLVRVDLIKWKILKI